MKNNPNVICLGGDDWREHYQEFTKKDGIVFPEHPLATWKQASEDYHYLARLIVAEGLYRELLD